MLTDCKYVKRNEKSKSGAQSGFSKGGGVGVGVGVVVSHFIKSRVLNRDQSLGIRGGGGGGGGGVKTRGEITHYKFQYKTQMYQKEMSISGGHGVDVVSGRGSCPRGKIKKALILHSQRLRSSW